MLNRDRGWALYPLADLEPELFVRGAWWCNEEAVTLLYRGFDPPILCAFGAAEQVRLLLGQMPHPPRVYLHVQPEIAALLREQYAVPEPRHMIRMVLSPVHFRPVAVDGLQRVGSGDAAALTALYRDGDAAGEAPGFFAPEMVEHGVYFGVRLHGDLIAVAGTHVLSFAESVAAIGNVYTRRDQRGRGLGSLTTSAVAGELLQRGVRTVALSVNRQNAGAIRIYQRLGFSAHCDFVEGVATRR